MAELPLTGVRVSCTDASGAGAQAAQELERLGATVTGGGSPGAIADVVIHGSRPASASAGNAVACTVTPFGTSGPWARYTARAESVPAAAGLSALTGRADGPPTLLDSATGPASLLAALATVAALVERKRPGAASNIEVSELEASLQGLWTAALDFTVNARERLRLGARDIEIAPHGVYRCKDGNWLAIACETEEEWFNLKVALGRPDWCELERMQTRARRIDEQDEIDRHISHWINEQTRMPDEPAVLVITMMDNLEVPRYTSHEMARYFQSFGVPAAVVERPGA